MTCFQIFHPYKLLRRSVREPVTTIFWINPPLTAKKMELTNEVPQTTLRGVQCPSPSLIVSRGLKHEVKHSLIYQSASCAESGQTMLKKRLFDFDDSWGGKQMMYVHVLRDYIPEVSY